MSILITGITGYIGSNLARKLLAEDMEIFGLVREPVRTEYIQDIQDRLTLLPYDGSYESMSAALEESRPELVYHLAAYYTGAHGPEITPALVESNIKLGACLLEAMLSVNCRYIICAGTVMEHFSGQEYCPLNLYAATKRAFYDLLCYYTDAGLLHSGTIVLSDTYGPRDRRPKILNLIKRAAKEGHPMDLSDGGQDYDLVHIEDVTDAFVMAGGQLMRGEWKNRRFQVFTENPPTLRETVETMLRVNGSDWRPGWGLRTTDGRAIQKAVRLCPPVPGWKPRVGLEDGLRELWER